MSPPTLLQLSLKTTIREKLLTQLPSKFRIHLLAKTIEEYDLSPNKNEPNHLHTFLLICQELNKYPQTVQEFRLLLNNIETATRTIRTNHHWTSHALHCTKNLPTENEINSLRNASEHLQMNDLIQNHTFFYKWTNNILLSLLHHTKQLAT